MVCISVRFFVFTTYIAFLILKRLLNSANKNLAINLKGMASDFVWLTCLCQHYHLCSNIDINSRPTVILITFELICGFQHTQVLGARTKGRIRLVNCWFKYQPSHQL